MTSQEQQEIFGLRQRINRLEAQIEQVYKHLGISYAEDLHANDDPQVVAALRSNNMIEAVKLYREKNNAGLTEAKIAVDEMRSRLGI